ncbi:MAG: DNA polymerase III subunit chi [Magnetovibrio sp.]|nr:DNA polymerase III subunit chi [Magnetovibrio sp.]
MTEVAFYHLTKSTLEQALPLLLGKTLEAGKRAVVLLGNEDRVEALNGALWTEDANSWLPHGSKKDGQAELQPVWLTDKDENPNGAAFVFLTDGAQCSDLAVFERCFELFDGTSDEAVQMARTRWKTYTHQGFDLTYWQQTDVGGWRKKET